MKIIEQSAKLIETITPQCALDTIEKAARICYQSECNEDSQERFIHSLIIRGHESVLEHISYSAHIICARSTANQLVRHRIASYSQESTRYCNYTKDKFNGEISVIQPYNVDDNNRIHSAWFSAMTFAEMAYIDMIRGGASPETARSVLPHCLKTELIMTTNLREWRHIFKTRCTTHAEPDIRKLMYSLLQQFQNILPCIFNNIVL